jgi:CHAT domain-containing protein
VTVLSGKAATKEVVTSHLPLMTYIHLATHGFFFKEQAISGLVRGGAPTPRPLDPESQIRSVRNPLVESGIALTGANVRNPTTMAVEGLLTAQEIVGLDLSRCELVTLSACETGRGEEVTGQGVMGLRASVLAAGARSMLMSLWDIGDVSTIKFMEHFYTNLWEKKMSKIEALKQAQEAVRNDPSGRFKVPFFWAAWVLGGEAWE